MQATSDCKRLSVELLHAKVDSRIRNLALRIMRTRMWPRYPSKTFLERHPRRGVKDNEVVAMKRLQDTGGFTFCDQELIWHLKPNHGMGVYRAVNDRFLEIAKKSKVLSRIGHRRTRRIQEVPARRQEVPSLEIPEVLGALVIS